MTARCPPVPRPDRPAPGVGTRGLAVALLAVVACSAPVLAGGFWLLHGVRGPIGPDSGHVVPALVTVCG